MPFKNASGVLVAVLRAGGTRAAPTEVIIITIAKHILFRNAKPAVRQAPPAGQAKSAPLKNNSALEKQDAYPYTV